MSLSRNAIANYAGQGYAALIGIIVMPLYLRYLGADAFGLIGFFIMFQAWMLLLDLGISPTLSRQVAARKDIAGGLVEFGPVLRVFELIFLVLGVAIAGLASLGSDLIASQWIDSQALPAADVASCVALMGGIFALRLFSSMYQSGIRGFEDQVWLNAANISIVSAKFIGALLIILLVTTDILVFFQYQLLIGIAEVLLYASRFYSKLGLNLLRRWPLARWAEISDIAVFALGIAYTAGVWVIVTQSDKLILSALLPLDEFGYFSLVGLVASGLLIASAPIGQAVLPRLTSLHAQNEPERLVELYRAASQLVFVISVSVALVVAVYARPFTYAWTGDWQAAEWVADVLPWFALGNGLLTIGAFPYFLQNALGQLRLHVIGTTISALVQLPIIYIAAVRYGAVGAGIAWFGIRVLWFLVWIPIVHRRYLPGFHVAWLVRDLLPILSVGLFCILALTWIIPPDWQARRLYLAAGVLAALAVQVGVTAMGSSFIRSWFGGFLAGRNSAAHG